MKEILSPRSRRQLELVELLADNDWVSFKTASDFLSIPVKTLKSDIVELEILLSPATIETSKVYGIRFATNNYLCKTAIYQKFIKNNIEFQLIEKTFLHNFATISDLANDLYISISTIKRIVSRVNQFLQIEGFKINLKKIQLVGDPHSICNFMLHYFHEKYGIAERLLTSAQLTILDQVGIQIVKQAIPNKCEHKLDFSLMNRLRFHTYAAINLVKHNDENKLHFLLEKEFEISKYTHNCDEFYSQFQLSLSPTNINSFFYLIFSSDFVDTIETLRELIKVDRNALLKYQKIEHFLVTIEKNMNSTCNNFDDLFMRLYNLDFQTHGRTYILHNKNKEFLTNIQNLYGHFPIEITYSLQAIFYLNPYKEYIVYEALSILFTSWPQLLNFLEYSTPTLKAGLFFSSGLDYMNMLSERINYYLRGRFSCTPIQVSSIEEIEKESVAYDCIITDIPEVYSKHIPVIVIPLIPDAKSFDKLMMVYENFFRKW